MFGRKAAKIKQLEKIHSDIKRHQLFVRTKNSINHTTNWKLRLQHFLENNSNNKELIIKIAGYHSYLIKTGCDSETAAKECLEYYQH